MTLLGDHFSFDQAHFSSYKFNRFEINGWTLERLFGELFGDLPPNPQLITTKRYLVTGGLGFIGSTLVDKLTRNNMNMVYVVDNESTGFRDNLPAALPENVCLEIADIGEIDFRNTIGYVDGIYHLAAMSKVLPSLANVDMVDFCLHENVQGTINVLKYAYRHNPPTKVVYSASSTCYGNGPVPNREDDLPQCQTPYALSKYCGELYCKLFSDLYKVPTIRLRYFMVFGPREPSEGSYSIVTGVFNRRKQNNLPLEIHGDGTQSRDFVHVHDIVEANMRAMNSDLINDTLNVGTGNTVSIKELANAISSIQVHVSSRPVDLKETLADTTLIRERLGFVPCINILETLNTSSWI